MKILMISPGWSKSSIWGHIWFKFPVISLPTLAAITPDHHEIRYVDDNIEPALIAADEDLVALTVMTPLAPRAYAIADFFRSHGKKVILGGVHPTFCPEEALQHADALVVGEGELSWPLALQDAEQGKLKTIYRAENLIESQKIPPPDRTILQNKKYFFTNLIQTTRGCPFDCEFCSVTSLYGGTYRVRPLEHIRQELDIIGKPGSFIFIVDDNIVGQSRYSQELFTVLKDYRYKWLSHASINLAFNDKLLRAAADSGCYGLFVGFESLNKDNLNLMGKKVNRIEYYQEAIARFHQVGIGVLGSFVLGYDHDQTGVFEEIFSFTVKTKLDGGLFTILTPYPGTKVRRRLEKQGRIISNDWSLYDMEHIVFRPTNMTVEQLYSGFKELTLSFHTVPTILKRLFMPTRSFQFFAPANFGFRNAWKKRFKNE
ncbi:B12-binding domain-containing radical SAM protein [candidate division CSSED10-310 bacterium]|uniref:B12-binding domain-containing radical SAM protein n=1 Tax=candidate division CSSED10-310 bacterium TaxID=2855610 RepID=A0ABV6Z005_UNCC1